MRLAIMQPYFMPYIGYFQLMNAVGKFVVYDNIQFTKKGWFHRNRILVNSNDKMITLPLKKDSDYLNICQRSISPDFRNERKKILRTIGGAYQKAPFYKDTLPLIEECLHFKSTNLFEFVFNSMIVLKTYLKIETPLIISSELEIDHNLTAENKVIAICKNVGCKHYINSIGGMQLYDKYMFKNNGIDLSFIKSGKITYDQFGNNFVPWLSIIDVLMFNPLNKIQFFLNHYELI